MDELLKAITRAANAVADYYDRQAHPMLPLAVGPLKPVKFDVDAEIAAAVGRTPVTAGAPGVTADATPAPAKKPVGRPKKAPATPAPAAPAPQAIHADYAKLTSEESEKAIFDVGEQLIDKFPTLGANGPDGQPQPEGFHMLTAILAEKFQGKRVAKLAHEERLAFMSIVREKLDSTPAAAPAPSNDPNLGV